MRTTVSRRNLGIGVESLKGVVAGLVLPLLSACVAAHGVPRSGSTAAAPSILPDHERSVKATVRLVADSQEKWTPQPGPIAAGSYVHGLSAPVKSEAVAAELEAACRDLAHYRAEISDRLRDFFISLPVEDCAAYYELVWSRVEEIRSEEYVKELQAIPLSVSVTNMPFPDFCRLVASLANATREAHDFQMRHWKEWDWVPPKDEPVTLVKFFLQEEVADPSWTWPLVTLSLTNTPVIDVLKKIDYPHYGISSGGISYRNAGGYPGNSFINPRTLRKVVEIKSDISAPLKYGIWEQIERAERSAEPGLRTRLTGVLGFHTSDFRDLVVSDAKNRRILMIASFATGDDLHDLPLKMPFVVVDPARADRTGLHR